MFLLTFVILTPATVSFCLGRSNNLTNHGLMTFTVLGILAILLIEYFFTWRGVCRKSGSGWWEGLPVVTLTGFLITVTILVLYRRYDVLQHLPFLVDRPIMDKVISHLTNTLKLREFLIGLTAIHMFFFALVRTLEHSIHLPGKHFRINELPAPKPSKNSNAFTVILDPLASILVVFNNMCRGVLEATANIIYSTLMYIFLFIRNFSKEIIKYLGRTAELLIHVNKKYILYYLGPLLLSYVIIYQVVVIISHAQHYINHGVFLHPISGIIHIALLYLNVSLLVWLLTHSKLSEALKAMYSHNLWITPILLISLVISSLVLRLLAHFLPESPYRSLGPVTVVLVVIIVIGLIGAQISAARGR